MPRSLNKLLWLNQNGVAEVSKCLLPVTGSEMGVFVSDCVMGDDKFRIQN